MNRLFGVLLGVAMLLVTFVAFGQAISMQVAMGRDNRNGMMVTMDQPADSTIGEVQLMLNHMGPNLCLMNGLGEFKAVRMVNICMDKLDLFIKILATHNNKSVVYMAVSRGYNSKTSKDSDSTITFRLGQLLNAFVKNPKGDKSIHQIAKN